MVNTLKNFPDEYSDISNTNFKSLFSKGDIANRGLIYFIIGNSDIKLLLKQRNNDLKHRLRITTFTA